MSCAVCIAEAKAADLACAVVEVLQAEVARPRAENARLNAEAATFCDRLQAAHEERDRLRAVLAEAATIVEETDVVEAPRGETYYAQLGDARATLKAAAAALRARAGMEPTPAGHEGPIRCGRCRENVCLCGGAP